MRNLLRDLRSVVSRLASGLKSRVKARALLTALGLIAGAGVAFALTNPPTYPPRQFNTQQTHYLRFLVNFNSAALNPDNKFRIKVGAVPYNAFLARITMQVLTVFNSASTDTLALGIASSDTSILAATTLTGTAQNGVSVFCGTSCGSGTFAGIGESAVGNNLALTNAGNDGGYEIWALYASTGGTRATQGSAAFIIEYVAPNDGACVSVPIGSTAAGC